MVAANAEGNTFVVSGRARPWLAGMPLNAQSPTEVTGVELNSGDTLIFQATGLVSHGGGTFPSGPEGVVGDAHAITGGAQNGISDIVAPYNALLGVFLGPADPTMSPPPARLLFGWTSTNRQYTTLSPLLKQVFYIGSGSRSNGAFRQINVPPGATRLFVGTMDTEGWSDNSGSFEVCVRLQRTTELALAVKLHPSLLVSGTIGRLVRVDFSDALVATNHWQPLTNIVLTQSPHYFFDTTASPTLRRFYRAVELP